MGEGIIMSSSLFDETLRTIYYDVSHPASFGRAETLYSAAKDITPRITKAYVTKWLQFQNVYSLHARLRKRFLRRKVIAPGMYHQMQMDLVDLSSLHNKNDGYKFLLCAIDVFSRKAFAIPIRSKKDVDVMKAIAEVFKNYPPVKYIQTDLGKEFYNRKVQGYLRQRNIKLFSTSSDVKSSIVERFNRTLKQRMFKYFTANDTVRYITVLPDMIRAYNNRKHRTLGVAPNEVTLANQSKVWNKQYQKYLLGYRKGKFAYKVGSRVRISKLARQFRKGYLPTYTDEVFTVHDQIATYPVTYKLSDETGNVLVGSFYEPELQLVRLPLEHRGR